MSKDQYPRLWQLGLIQKQVRLRANHTCEQCGMKFLEGTNIAKTATNRLGKPMIGGAHHIDFNKQNCSINNLVYLCQSCHWVLHMRGWKPRKGLPKAWNDNPPQWILDRNLLFIRQIPLFKKGGK